MKNQLIPPVDLAPQSVKHLSLKKRIELWIDLVEECDAFLLAGLQSRVGPNGDLRAAYRSWCDQHAQDHEKRQIQFLEQLTRREAAGGN